MTKNHRNETQIHIHKNTYSVHLKGKVKDFSIRMTATFQRHTSRRVSFWKKSNNRKITDSNVEKSTNAPSDKSHTIRWNVFLPFYVLMVAGFSAVYLFNTIFSSISFFSIFFLFSVYVKDCWYSNILRSPFELENI